MVDAKIRRIRERRESEKIERKKLFTHRRATEVGREYQRLQRLDYMVSQGQGSESSKMLDAEHRLSENYSRLLSEAQRAKKGNLYEMAL